MTILDILTKASKATGGLKDLLVKVKAQAPDLAEEVDTVLAALDVAVDPANLAALGVSVASEVKDILTGHIVSKDHPSDGA